MTDANHPRTPDGRYFVVRGRLWRLSNPGLTDVERDAAVKKLMDARRDLRGHPAPADAADARRRVDEAKVALGERGPVWWTEARPTTTVNWSKTAPMSGLPRQPPLSAGSTASDDGPRRGIPDRANDPKSQRWKSCFSQR